MERRIMIGVDTGKSGGICVMREPNGYLLYATNDDNKVYHDDMVNLLIKILQTPVNNAFIILENPFGHYANWICRAQGNLMTMLRHNPHVVRFDFVSPNTWKKNLNKLIPSMKGNNSQKTYHKLIKDYLYKPDITHDQCAAYGIAYWGWCKYCESQSNLEGEQP